MKALFNFNITETSENTPSRSGLRKRKRPETPQKTEKQVSEEWVDEDQLQLWEIKLFGERYVFVILSMYFLDIYYFEFNRLEKALLQPVTRASTGKLPSNRAVSEVSTPNRANSAVRTVPTTSISSNSKQVVINQKTNADEIKEKMEQELRIQRAEHHKKRTLEMMQQKRG